MKCWICGVEPDETHEITTFGDAEPQYLPKWPAATDHQHAERRPTPGELEQAGHDALMRIRRDALYP